MRSFIVIPARLASTRLPRKLLLNETGKPLIQHTYEAACKATRPRGVIIAADDAEIATVVWGFGGWVEMTSPDCASGTDRVAEVARKLTDVDVLVNVQGDEPEISATAIDLAVQLLEDNPAAVITLRYEFRPALISLGVFPRPQTDLQRRERAHGFDNTGYCPTPR